MEPIDIDLTEHLRLEHHMSPFQTYLKEIVYGGNDGIVTTFAVVAGFTGAQAGTAIPTYSFLTVLLFGLANLFADGASMGLGNFLSVRSEQDSYKKQQKKELYEIRHHPEMELKETIQILINKGYDEKDAAEMARLYSKNERYWLQFMMDQELELPNPTGEKPHLTALATALAFITFGFIPLSPYLFTQNTTLAFSYSLAATATALILLGLLRWRVTKESLARSVLEIVTVGGLAAAIAFTVGSFFN
jgi:vacuolar iron transporter family protein